jgi:hypothetical protein
MSCCGPKAPSSAQQARPEPEGTAKHDAAGCCGGGKAEAKTTATEPQVAGAPEGARNTHAH